MVQAAKADVIGPAVAAKAPHALADQVIGRGRQAAGVGRVDLGQPLQQFYHAAALQRDLRVVILRGVDQAPTSSSPSWPLRRRSKVRA